MKNLSRCLPLALGAALLQIGSPLADAQVISSLDSLSMRIDIDDPNVSAADGQEGAKAIATADLNGDGNPDIATGNLDGTVTILLATGGGGFEAPRFLTTGAIELRAVEPGDYNGDGMIDLAIASPEDGKLHLFMNVGGGNFGSAVALPAWAGVRSLEAGDYDGDGTLDLAAAGPGLGLRHYRGTGGGQFEVMGDLPRLGPEVFNLPRPVFSLSKIRSVDGSRDDLLLTHADSPSLYVLSTQPADRSTEPALAMSPAGWEAVATDAPVTDLLLSEVQVHNDGGHLDADGEAQPWVEIFNKSGAPLDLSAWELHADNLSWTLPAVSLEPGRFLVVFMSGKDRGGAELHAGMRLEDAVEKVSLVSGGQVLHSIALESHSVDGVSFGLPMDSLTPEWFDLPSPGASNNAGFSKLSSVRISDTVTTLTVTPENPGPGDEVVVTVRTPDSTLADDQVRSVWFSTTGAIAERHHPLKKVAPGVHSVKLPPGSYDATTKHRVLARFRPDDWGKDDGGDFSIKIHDGIDEDNVSEIAVPQPGRLLPVASVPSPEVKAFAVGAVTRNVATSPLPDLVYADDACGLLRVHRGVATAQRFEMIPTQDLQVRGAPRDVALADIDGDGWIDATVVLRTLDLALTCKNDKGFFKPIGELPTGRSPRAVAMADFNGDGRPDAAVINRYSADVSILTSSDGVNGLVSNDQIYPVDGEVARLTVVDYDGDGRDDVVQLHRGSGEVSVRYSKVDGSLKDPVYLTLPGERPSGIETADINGDGVLDTVTANLGGWGGNGSISTLLSQPDGSVAPGPSIDGVGAMFSIAVADFDNDGYKDLVAGLFDCRVSFFRGDGSGGFTLTRSQPFAYEARLMVVADFDQDGDTDIAGAGADGNMVVLTNNGTILDSSGPKDTYPPPSGAFFGAERIALYDADGDVDPDLVIGSGAGVLVYRGIAGTGFEYDSTISNSLPTFSVSDVVTLDLDGDGTQEMVMLCGSASCINILTQSGPNGTFVPVAQATIPSGRYLATGDLDGDGKPDLVCSGDVLWTLLSSRPPEITEPNVTSTERGTTSGVLINEVLMRNTGTPVASDSGRKTDFIEIYNSTEVDVAIGGWKLEVEGTQDGAPFSESYTIPERTLAPGSYSVVLFSDKIANNPAYTGFTLPAERSTVRLKRVDDSVADATETPRALDNVSWSRFRDGHPTFHGNPIPSPGMSNIDNGTPDPDVKLTPPKSGDLIPGRPIKFTAVGNDDVGIVSLSLLWKPLGVAGETERIILYDDGMHDDGLTTDGYFAGELASGLPAGSEVQFYLEATDLSGNTIRLPEDATLVEPGTAPNAWTLSLEASPTLEIAEIAPFGNAAHRDESRKKADYVVVRNTGNEAVEMGGVLLAKSPLSSGASTYAFPAELTLSPGAEAVVFADDDVEDGPMHAPFTLDAGGGELSLLAESASGARRWIDSLSVPPTTTNLRYRKLPGTERWVYSSGSAPDAPVGNGQSITSYDSAADPLPAATTRTIAGDSYHLEGFVPIPGAWETIDTFTGDGNEVSFVLGDEIHTGLRITHQPPLPQIASVSAVADRSSIWIFVDAPDAAQVIVYTDRNNDLSGDPEQLVGLWSQFATPSGEGFAIQMPIIVESYYRVLASNASGMVWSEPGFIELENVARFNTLGLESLSPASATLGAQFFENGDRLVNIRVVYGTSDGLTDLAQWSSEAACTREEGTSKWRADIAGLQEGQQYYARFVGDRLDGSKVFSGARLAFRATDDPAELIRNGLRFTEIMYHPYGPTNEEEALGYAEEDFEFLELHNATDIEIDLSGWSFTAGMQLAFPLVDGPVIQPGQRAIIAAHPYAFAHRYGSDIPLLDWRLHPFVISKLSNKGENIALSSPDGGIEIRDGYNDVSGFDDGGGYSLERGLDGGWASSRFTGGSPGFSYPIADMSFADWQANKFNGAEINHPPTVGSDADPDGDGLTNLEEFFFGTEPKVADGSDRIEISLREINGGSKVIDIRFRQDSRAIALGPILERRRDGGVFEAVLPAWSFYESGSEMSPDGRHVIRTFSTSVGTVPRAHFRIRLELP